MDWGLIVINVDASIEPGKASAGFSLGQSLAEIQRQIDLSGMKTWARANGEQLAYCIKDTAGWLRVPVTEISEGRFGGEVWHYSHGMIELHFGQSGTLFEISVFEGYRGCVLGTIKVGMPMADLEVVCPLLFDDAEEVYLPKEDRGLAGLSFYIDEAKGEPLVHGISVFDFKLDA